MSEGIDAVLKLANWSKESVIEHLIPLFQDHVGLDKGQDDPIAGHYRNAGTKHALVDTHSDGKNWYRYLLKSLLGSLLTTCFAIYSIVLVVGCGKKFC